MTCSSERPRRRAPKCSSFMSSKPRSRGSSFADGGGVTGGGEGSGAGTGTGADTGTVAGADTDTAAVTGTVAVTGTATGAAHEAAARSRDAQQDGRSFCGIRVM